MVIQLTLQIIKLQIFTAIIISRNLLRLLFILLILFLFISVLLQTSSVTILIMHYCQSGATCNGGRRSICANCCLCITSWAFAFHILCFATVTIIDFSILLWIIRCTAFIAICITGIHLMQLICILLFLVHAQNNVISWMLKLNLLFTFCFVFIFSSSVIILLSFYEIFLLTFQLCLFLLMYMSR